jgi:hypothetical protein
MKKALGINFPSKTIIDISILWKDKKKHILLNMINVAIFFLAETWCSVEHNGLGCRCCRKKWLTPLLNGAFC